MIIGISGKAGSGKDTVASMIQYLTRYQDKSFDSYKAWYVDKFILRDKGTLAIEYQWEIKHWAGKLKDVASILTGIDRDLFDNPEFKKGNLDSNWDYTIIASEMFTMEEGSKIEIPTSQYMGTEFPVNPKDGLKRVYSIRKFLQHLGTDAVRHNLHPSTWINALMSEYRPINPEQRKSLGNVLDYSDCIFPNWLIPDTRFPNEVEAIRKRKGMMILVQRPELVDTMDHTSETALDGYKEWDAVIINYSLEELYENVQLLVNNWYL